MLPKKNLILGAIKNYDWTIIQPFFLSLKKANFQNYDCIIFAFNISQNTLDELKNIGVIIQEIPEKYGKMKINNVRYKLYEEYLSDKLDKYKIVLHSDVRDTFFQKDFFQIYENQDSFIGFALEDGNINQTMNADWMKNQYGEKIYEEVKHEKIICSGTIWGTIDKFYELVGYIWKEIELKSPYDYSIHDQTITNYLVYYKKMFKDCILISDNNYGPVMTVGLAQYQNFSYDQEENLINFKEKNIASIVHQYDRVPKMVNIIKRKFLLNNNGNLNLSSKIQKFNIKKIFLPKFSEFTIHSNNNTFIIMVFCLISLVLIKKFKKIYSFFRDTTIK